MPKPGDRLQDFITTAWYDEVTNAAKKYKVGGRPVDESEQWAYIIVKNHSTTARTRWEAVSLGTPALDYTSDLGISHKEFIFNTTDYDGDDPHNLVILQEPLPGAIGATAKALVVGRSWLFLPEPKTSLNYVSISALDQLEYSNTGRIEVLRDFAYTIPSSSPAIGLGLGPSSIVTPSIPFGPTTQSSGGYIAFVLIGKLSTGGGIIDIRINGFDFEYTFDGTNWIVWGEGTSCTS